MKLTPDSPELTAYALDALDALDPEQRLAVEAAIASDPRLQAEVVAIRKCAQALTQEFALEPRAALTGDQRQRIRDASQANPGSVAVQPDPGRPRGGGLGDWWRSLWNPAWGLALAGAAAVVLTLWLRPPSEPLAEEQSEADIARNLSRYQPGRVLERTAAAASAAVKSQAIAPKTQPVPASGAPAPVQTVPVAPTRTLAPAGAAPASEARQETRLMRSAPTPKVQAPQAAPQATLAPPPTVAPLEDRRARDRVERGSAPAPTPATRGSAEVLQRGQKVEVRTKTAALAAGLPIVQMDEPRRQPPSDSFRPDPLMAGPVGGAYAPLADNPFRPVIESPLSTFGLDVDTASYANVRRHLNAGRLPPADAVRLEEMVNYFTYTHREPAREHPVGIETELAESPYTAGNRLVRIALKARDIARSERPPANLVFLVDVSGSMEPEDRLPLIQRSLRMLTESLTARDRVSLVTYAGEAGVRLPSSSGAEKEPIVKAIDTLKSGGSTHGSAGIRLAYEQARAHFNAEGINRVILCTDGDFNVGMTSREALLELISGEAKTGVFLTVLGFGMDNYKDATTELLADQGNGNYAYIDSFREARKVLAEQLESTLVTVAKDVKLQVEFNPARVRSWRLLGYENRALADRDFNDDAKDAGDLGAGHTVTALYELVMVGGTGPGVDPLRYERPTAATGLSGSGVHTNELMHIKLRYKKPDDDRSRLLQLSVADASRTLEQAGDDFRFSAAAAGLAMLLRNSPHKGTLTYDQVLRMAESALGRDPGGYRAEFVDLARRARQLNGGR